MLYDKDLQLNKSKKKSTNSLTDLDNLKIRDTIRARARVRYPEKLKFRAEKGKYGHLHLREIALTLT